MEELRIGQVEGDEIYSFGRVTDLTVGKDGSIFTADINPTSLRKYDAEGRFVRVIGRVGEGPGEYRRLTAIALLPNDNIAVRDDGLGRVTIYNPQGEYQSSLEVRTGYSAADIFRIDELGNFLVKARARPVQLGVFELDRPMVWIRIK
ncbi:MAG: 6-bladed beta-propeller [Gemmatimonadota bacterium]